MIYIHHLQQDTGPQVPTNHKPLFTASVIITALVPPQPNKLNAPYTKANHQQTYVNIYFAIYYSFFHLALSYMLGHEEEMLRYLRVLQRNMASEVDGACRL
jgi:hypothetical protein